KFKVSTSPPVADCQWVGADWPNSFGKLASEGTEGTLGRLGGSGVIRPWRLRMRQTVTRDGVLEKRPARWWRMVCGPASKPAAESSLRSSRIASTTAWSTWWGQEAGRWDLGSRAPGPSRR